MCVKDKIKLLSTPIWSLQQLMSYLDVKSRTTGIKIKKKAFDEYDGKTDWGTKFVKRDSIMAMLETTAEREIKILNEKLQN